MPRVEQILETSLYVQDLKRSSDFYKTLFGFEVLDADDRFCALSVADRQVLLLFKQGASSQPIAVPAGIIPPHDGNGPLHLAFSITKSDLKTWEARLTERGIDIESKITWPKGGQSVYFRDPDGHLIELGTAGLWTFGNRLLKERESL